MLGAAVVACAPANKRCLQAATRLLHRGFHRDALSLPAGLENSNSKFCTYEITAPPASLQQKLQFPDKLRPSGCCELALLVLKSAAGCSLVCSPPCAVVSSGVQGRQQGAPQRHGTVECLCFRAACTDHTEPIIFSHATTPQHHKHIAHRQEPPCAAYCALPRHNTC